MRRAGELHLLVEKGADHGAAVGVGVVQQGVEVRQQSVSDVQHVPGNVLKSGVPGSRILPLEEKRVLLEKLDWTAWES